MVGSRAETRCANRSPLSIVDFKAKRGRRIVWVGRGGSERLSCRGAGADQSYRFPKLTQPRSEDSPTCSGAASALIAKPAAEETRVVPHR